MEFDFGKDLSNIIVRYFLPFLAVGAIGLVIFIGIRFAMSKDEKERQEAKKRFMSMVSVCLIFTVICGILVGANFMIQGRPTPPPLSNDRLQFSGYQQLNIRNLDGLSSGSISVNPTTPTPRRVLTTRFPVDFDMDHRNYLQYDATFAQSPLTRSIIPAESLSSVYGWRRVFTPEDVPAFTSAGMGQLLLQTTNGLPNGVLLSQGVMTPATSIPRLGHSENNFGIDIDMGWGEGIGVLNLSEVTNISIGNGGNAGNHNFTINSLILNGVSGSTSIRNNQPRDNTHGILLERPIVSDFARISVITPEPATINLRILDNLGNIVFTETSVRAGLKPAPTNATDNAIVWNLTNPSGRYVANGTYLIIVETQCLASPSGRRFTYSSRIGINR